MNTQTYSSYRKPLVLLSLAATINLIGCASQPVASNTNDDPWQSWNKNVFKFNNDFDKAVLKPMAKGYQDITPGPVDKAVTNFFSNINDIGVSINDLLQFKFLQSGMDVSRFIVNSTAGVAGFIDVASEIDLPKHDEDFGQTLGFWGMPSGSYMVLPFLGASSPRDALGLLGDALLNPLTYVSIFGGVAANAATGASSVLDVTDTRSDVMSTEKIIDEGSVNRYDFVKQAYQQHRNYVIHDGNPPEDSDDLLLQQENEQGSGVNAGTDSGINPNIQAMPATNTGEVPVINNSKTLPEDNSNAPAPIINNSKHFLELSPPD